MLQHLREYVSRDFKVMQAIIDYSGLTKAEVLNKLRFGNGPEIIIDNISGYGEFDGNKNPNSLVISKKFAAGLEVAISPETIRGTSFLLAVTALHEFVHYGRFFKGLDRTYEYGFGFERDAYGVRITKENANTYSWKFYKK